MALHAYLHTLPTRGRRWTSEQCSCLTDESWSTSRNASTHGERVFDSCSCSATPSPAATPLWLIINETIQLPIVLWERERSGWRELNDPLDGESRQRVVLSRMALCSLGCLGRGGDVWQDWIIYEMVINARVDVAAASASAPTSASPFSN